jgi:hypothetical protein
MKSSNTTSMISKVMGVMSKMQLPLVVLHKDISKAAVIKEIVGKAARVICKVCSL